ncbi:MAG TPA: HD domain-containing protein [Roseiflexaceae bacterium]|nr:HD domain-containing protein [Roseiflexaceae bacterium]
MHQPDYERAREYALRRLRQDLSPLLSYHSLAHTCDEVLPASERYARLLDVGNDDLLLLRTAALYHDIGFVEQAVEHEAAGARIAATVLPRFGYHDTQIRQICAMIMATRLPQSPNTLLEAILADADLDMLGREDYLARNRALRAEWAIQGRTLSDPEWYADQLAFICKHHYWTEAAQSLRNPGKQRNIQTVLQLLRQCDGRA